MADDPRELSPAEWLRRPAFNPLGRSAERAPQRDPLRALLADEDRAAQLFVPIISEWESFTAGDGHKSIGMKEPRTPEQVAAELLAALREVAGL